MYQNLWNTDKSVLWRYFNSIKHIKNQKFQINSLRKWTQKKQIKSKASTREGTKLSAEINKVINNNKIEKIKLKSCLLKKIIKLINFQQQKFKGKREKAQITSNRNVIENIAVNDGFKGQT